MLEVNPTLLIGVGGSGREILLRIRRRFFEAGYLEQPAWIAFLWIDTAIEVEESKYLTDSSGATQPFDHVAARTAFRESEKCDIGLLPADLEQLANPATADQYKNILEWFDPSELKKDAALTPPRVRLALFLRAKQVCKKIGDCLKQLHQPKVIANLESALSRAVMPKPSGTDQFEVFNECQTFIVGSLAGATGAGLCLDLAAMLKSARSLFQFEIRMAVWAHYLLPEAFSRDANIRAQSRFDSNRSEAIGYAALQEIERALKPAKAPEPPVLKASWLTPENPASAHEIRVPIYDAVALYDGANPNGPSDAPIADSFAQIAHLLYAELRIRPSKIHGLPVYGWVTSRILMLGLTRENPSPSTSNETTAYSLRYVAIGFARVACEAARLRLMAAYTLAAKALQDWLGDPPPALGTESESSSRQRQAALDGELRCIESRLIQEFSNCVTEHKTRWREVLIDEKPCTLLQPLQQVTSRAQHPEFFEQFLSFADHWPSEWPAEELGERFLNYYFKGTNPRLDFILRSLVDAPALEGWEIPEDLVSSDRAGGLHAAELALGFCGDGSRRSIIESALLKAISQFTRKAAALAAHNDESREKLRAVIGTYIQIVGAFDRGKNSFWVKKATLDHLFNERLRCSMDLQRALSKWVGNVQKQKVYEAVRNGLEALSKRTLAIQAALDEWRRRLQGARALFGKLLQNPEATAANPQYGLLQILAQFRARKPDGASLQLRLELQTDEKKLWTEILTAYAGDERGLFESLMAIQRGMLTAWRELLFDPKGRNEKLPGKYLAHVTDLATYERFGAMSSAAQIDYLAALGLAQQGSRGLLKKTHIREAFLTDAQLAGRLRAMSGFKLQRREIRPRNFTGKVTEHDHPDFKERAVFIGPVGVQPETEFTSVESDNRFEAYCMRYAYFVALPDLLCLSDAPKALLAAAPADFYLTRAAKNDPPIHNSSSALGAPESDEKLALNSSGTHSASKR